MKKTPLYDAHISLKAKMVEFSGWEMPLYYTDIITEHMAVRESAGLFDISHMGKIEIKGKDSPGLLEMVCTNKINRLDRGEVCYSLICNRDGGIIDDVLVYKLNEGYLLVVNAVNLEGVFSWITKASKGMVEIKDVTEKLSSLAIQGPKTGKSLERIIPFRYDELRYYHFKKAYFRGGEIILSRTGYTGEDGFEIFITRDNVIYLWQDIMKRGGELIMPAGLGARDTLRIEAGLPLYGHELSLDINPLEAGLEKYVDFEKSDFIGRDALIAIKKNRLKRRHVYILMIDEIIPRQGYPLKNGEGEVIGKVTSGTYSPLLKKGIAIGYVDTGYETQEFIYVDARNKIHKARILKGPFYRKGRIWSQ